MDVAVHDGDLVMFDGDIKLCESDVAIAQQLQHLLFTKPGELLHSPAFGFDLHAIFNQVGIVDSATVAQLIRTYLSNQLKEHLVYGSLATVTVDYDDNNVYAHITISTPSQLLTRKTIKFNLAFYTQEVIS